MAAEEKLSAEARSSRRQERSCWQRRKQQETREKLSVEEKVVGDKREAVGSGNRREVAMTREKQSAVAIGSTIISR